MPQTPWETLQLCDYCYRKRQPAVTTIMQKIVQEPGTEDSRFLAIKKFCRATGKTEDSTRGLIKRETE
jgi:hypothetical protein